MNYSELLTALAAGAVIICGTATKRVQYNLLGGIEVFDMETDTAEPLRICHLRLCKSLTINH